MKKVMGIAITTLLIISMATLTFGYSPFGLSGNMMPGGMNQQQGMGGPMGQNMMENQQGQKGPIGQRPDNETIKTYLQELVNEGLMTSDQLKALLVLFEDDSTDPIKTGISKGIITHDIAKALGQKLHGSSRQNGMMQGRQNGMMQGGQNGMMQSGQDNMPSMDGGMMPPRTSGNSMSIEEGNAIEEDYVESIGYYASPGGYPIVGTNQTTYFSDNDVISAPDEGDRFYGQDANYDKNAPSYVDNGDGTVTDLVTGLMWQQDPGDKMTWQEAIEGADDFDLAGYDDWRLPTVKELYSLIQFNGVTGSDASNATPYIDSNYFEFSYGTETGERHIDSQYASSTIYESGTMTNDSLTMFGVNFADGRIKGYGITMGKEFYCMYVRGNTTYGENLFEDNGDGTVTDEATGLMWMTVDSGFILEDGTMDWESALEWAENLEYAGYDDWRLPDAKELQSIVDYNRSLDTTDSAALDPIFEATSFVDFDGSVNYPYYWSSTTHQDGRVIGSSAIYVAFGEAKGYMNDTIMDAHGAGAQRSDPKTGDREDYPSVGNGPQGDARVVFNYVKLVRDAD